MKVRFYGRLANVVASELELDVPKGCTVSQLRDILVREHPEAEAALRGRRSRACVADAIVDESYVPGAAEAVEFLPPVSGG